MDDDTYRQMLEDMFGVSSSGKLNQRQRWQLIARFKQLGAEFIRKNKNRKPDDPQAQKIRALWLTLHKAGIVRDSSDAALNKYVKRMTGKEALSWINTHDGVMVIESLKKWIERTESEAI